MSERAAAPPSILQTDPGASYRAHKAAIDAAVVRVLAGGTYILGAEVEAFERAFAAAVGAGQAVGVASGTDAVELALRALGVGPGDRVITVSLTAVATVAAIERAGAVPVLVDIDAGYGMDVAALRAALDDPASGKGAKAVVPVHLYGQAADMPAIAALAKAYGCRVVEDAAQAHGATVAGRPVGGWGDAAAWSFYPTKNLGAFGDGGAVTTHDADLASRLRELREYGWRARYVSALAGVNSRLDALQAAILAAKLPFLATDNARRAAHAQRYDRGLASLSAAGTLARPWRRPGAGHAFHQYVVEVADRDAVRERLVARGVQTGVHYPQAVHQQPAYRDRLPLGPTGLARSDKAASRVLSLPLYPQLAAEEVARVIEALRSELAGRSTATA